jgi:hypothetical protein
MMMASGHDTPAERAIDDADARYAAYLADLAAHVDDPDLGEEYRAMLAEDPETRRAWFDVAEDLQAAPGYSPASVVWTALMIAVAVLVMGVVVQVTGFHL